MADIPSKKRHSERRFRQYLTAVVVNLTSLVNGVAIGWTSPVLPLLQSDANPVDGLAMSDASASWLGSILAAGALLSTPLYGVLCKHCSRKIVGYTVGLFALLGWCLILFARSHIMLLLGRLSLGIYATVPRANTCSQQAMISAYEPTYLVLR
ncbi:uncharacterized protein LOC134541991 isoform X2 [Bacillus rossius redtenbacheri]|uniref:uncharacterized protein LOC134541991 isoform X2 n=1 Tax=Bacillus rossius redtenbacheri TaxID=93214 RepID=UPI002FDD4464